MPESAEPVADGAPGLVERLYSPIRAVVHEVAKFGIVGAVAFVIDVGLFNLLLYFGPLQDKPLTAKVVSVVAATTFAYFGNRFWTYRNRGRRSMRREYVLFFVFNGIALLISVGCLWFSHYVLGLDSPLADNISANVVGVLLGTLFRFVAYRTWVFPALPDDAADQELAERDAATPI
jgi:putative flippase GtrA